MEWEGNRNHILKRGWALLTKFRFSLSADVVIEENIPFPFKKKKPPMCSEGLLTQGGREMDCASSPAIAA